MVPEVRSLIPPQSPNRMRASLSATSSLASRAMLLALLALSACSKDAPRPRVAGTMRFRLGANNSASAPINASIQPASLVAQSEYLVSPRKAKITFTSVVFRDAAGATLGTSDFSSCIVTYDRSLASGSTLLDCPFTAPVGEIAQMALYFSKTLDLLVSDATTGIYTDASSTTKYVTTPPAGGASFVSFTITIGDNNPSRATPVIFATPLVIAEGTTPTLYVTT